MIIIDELGLLVPEALPILRETLRSSNPAVPVIGVRATANPGGPSHTYVKQHFVDSTDDGRQVVTDEQGLTTRFIRASVYDNPHIDRKYLRRLEAIEDPARRKAMLDGDFSAPSRDRYSRNGQRNVTSSGPARMFTSRPNGAVSAGLITASRPFGRSSGRLSTGTAACGPTARCTSATCHQPSRRAGSSTAEAKAGEQYVGHFIDPSTVCEGSRHGPERARDVLGRGTAGHPRGQREAERMADPPLAISPRARSARGTPPSASATTGGATRARGSMSSRGLARTSSERCQLCPMTRYGWKTSTPRPKIMWQTAAAICAPESAGTAARASRAVDDGRGGTASSQRPGARRPGPLAAYRRQVRRQHAPGPRGHGRALWPGRRRATARLYATEPVPVRLTQAQASAAMTICAIVANTDRAFELEQDGRLAEGRAIREQIDATLSAEDLRLIAGGALGALAILTHGDADLVMRALWLDTTFVAELGDLEGP